MKTAVTVSSVVVNVMSDSITFCNSVLVLEDPNFGCQILCSFRVAGDLNLTHNYTFKSNYVVVSC